MRTLNHIYSLTYPTIFFLALLWRTHLSIAQVQHRMRVYLLGLRLYGLASLRLNTRVI